MEISDLYRKYSKDNNIREFYNNQNFYKYHLVSYNELLSILGEDKIETEFPFLRKNLLRIHTDMNNAACDTLYKYKFYPLIIRSLYCLVKKKTPSLLIHGSYVFFVDLIFRKFTIFQLSLLPIIHSGQFLDHSVTKTSSFKEREEYIRNYFEVLRSRGEDYNPEKMSFWKNGYIDYLAFKINSSYYVDRMIKEGMIVTNEEEILEKKWNDYLINTLGFAFIGNRLVKMVRGEEIEDKINFKEEIENYLKRTKMAFKTLPMFKYSRFNEPNIK